MDLVKALQKEHKEVLKGIEHSKKKAEAILAAIQAVGSAANAAGHAFTRSLSRRKRKMSAAGRAKIAAAQKARWAKVRKAQKAKEA